MLKRAMSAAGRLLPFAPGYMRLEAAIALFRSKRHLLELSNSLLQCRNCFKVSRHSAYGQVTARITLTPLNDGISDFR